jgi:multiple sugar transport system ATP-binding protein
MTMADRMVVMNAGRIEQIGRPARCLRSPGDALCRSVHRIAGDQRDRGDAKPGAVPMLEAAGGIELALPAAAAAPGQRVIAAFRPEHVRIDAAGPLQARVSVVETLGPETYVYLDVAGRTLCARVDRSERLAPNDALRLDVPASAIHLFGEDGRRLSAAIP